MLSPVVAPAGPERVAEIRFSERVDGDFGVDAEAAALRRRRRAVVDRPWSWLTQVHGADVAVANGAGSVAGVEADALVTRTDESPVSVLTADCAPVVLVGPGVVAVVHAGWRGLVRGIVDRAVAATGVDPGGLSAHLGPVIRPADYEFAGPELDDVIGRFGPGVRATTRRGSPAIDLPRTVEVALAEVGVTDLVDHGFDVADLRFWSHRLRGDGQRQSTVAWLRAA